MTSRQQQMCERLQQRFNDIDGIRVDGDLVARDVSAERLIEVSWDSAPDQTFMVKLIIQAEDRKNLLMDISNMLSQTSTNIASGNFSAEETLAHWNGSGRAPRLLAALDGQLSISKSRLALKSGTAPFRLLTPAGHFASLPAPSAYAQRINIEPPRRAAAQ